MRLSRSEEAKKIAQMKKNKRKKQNSMERLREFRVAGLAVVDLAATYLSACVVSWWTEWPFPLTLPGMFLLGIGVHELLGIDTPLNAAILRGK